MAEQHSIPKAYLPPIPIPPGETIREMLDTYAMSQLELARRMGKPHQAVNEIVNGKKEITIETAIQLERVLGLSASFWRSLEMNYRATIARDRELEHLQAQESDFREFPYTELVKRRLIKPAKLPADRIGAALDWLRVGSYRALNTYLNESVLAYRKSPKYDLPTMKLAAWLRIGEILHEELELADFDAEQLRLRIPEIRSLILLPPVVWVENLQRIGAECGVAFLFVEEFESFPVSGITRWYRNNPTIQLTLRGKRADIFWFSLFHEIGHVLLHSSRDVFIEVETDQQQNPFETEADEFASDTLIPPDFYHRIAATPRIHGMQIESWATEIGITPGIILGRLQEDGVIPRDRMNYLHQKVDWGLLKGKDSEGD